MKRILAAIIVIICFSPLLGFGRSSVLHCEHWPMTMALVSLKNNNIIAGDEIQDNLTKIQLMASDKIGHDLYRQVYHMSFYEKSGKMVEVITNNEASSVECSVSAVDVYVVGSNIGRR